MPKALTFRFLLLIALGSALATTANAQQLHAFRTPSGNIHCLAHVDEGQTEVSGIDCDIADRGGNSPIQDRPADCDGDFGQRFALGATSAARLECAGDSVRMDGSPALLYGGSLQFGKITCTSRSDGLECKNAGGRGFFLSKAIQKIF